MLEAFFIIRYNIIETHLTILNNGSIFYQKDHILANYSVIMP